VSEPALISSGIAARYATAVFALARESKSLKTLAADIATVDAALAESADFRDLITSPVYRRSEQAAAIAALTAKMGLGETLANALRLMAEKRRLFVLPQLLSALRERIAEEKGEVSADVATAKALSRSQIDRLAAALEAATGKKVNLNRTVDASLIGGLVVKVGSRMIDTSISAKLANLQNAMKEVG